MVLDASFRDAPFWSAGEEEIFPSVSVNCCVIAVARCWYSALVSRALEPHAASDTASHTTTTKAAAIMRDLSRGRFTEPDVPLRAGGDAPRRSCRQAGSLGIL